MTAWLDAFCRLCRLCAIASNNSARLVMRSSAMKQSLSPYVISFQAEPSYNGRRRHHWMICRARNPEELVSWGHELTHELAEAAAGKELQDLSAGLA